MPDDFGLCMVFILSRFSRNHDFEGNVLSALDVVGHPDRGEAAMPKFMLDTVFSIKHFSDADGEVEALRISRGVFSIFLELYLVI